VTVEHPRIHWLADPAVLAPIILLVVVYVRRFLQVRREGAAREEAGRVRAAAAREEAGPGRAAAAPGATGLHALAFAVAILALLVLTVSSGRTAR